MNLKLPVSTDIDIVTIDWQKASTNTLQYDRETSNSLFWTTKVDENPCIHSYELTAGQNEFFGKQNADWVFNGTHMSTMITVTASEKVSQDIGDYTYDFERRVMND